MDVHMPVMDGMAATRHIRDWERGQGTHIPIIAVTASTMQSERAECFESGMDGFVAKPIGRGAIAEAIHNAIGTVGASLPATSADDRQAEHYSGPIQ